MRIRRRKKLPNGEIGFDTVITKGHLDEVNQLRKGGSKLGGTSASEARNSHDMYLTAEEPHMGESGIHCLILTEGSILGGGAFSRVSEVQGMYHSALLFTVGCL